MTKKPNILMLFPDQWRGDWLGTNDQLPLRTPNLDKLLQRGTGFGRAWTPSPLCAPARSCFATGKGYGRAPVLNNAMDNPITVGTFYRCLGDAGYQVANAGKSDLLKGGNSWGADGRHIVDGVDRMAAIGFNRGFDSAGKKAAEQALLNNRPEPYTSMLKSRGLAETFLADYAKRSVGSSRPPMSDWIDGKIESPSDAYANVEPVRLPDDAYNDNFVGDAAHRLIQEFDPDQPWFLIVNFPGPHEPMDVTQSMADSWKDETFPLPRLRNNSDQELQQDIRRRYAAMLENIDRWLGIYQATLDETGQLENTIIVFASDHGEMLGDRNLWKKQVPFEASVHVPTILAGPGIQSRGMQEGVAASLLDLPTTFLSWGGADLPADFEGFDLSAYLAGDATYPRDTTVSGLGPWRAVCDGRYKLVFGFDPSLFQEQLQYEAFDRASLTQGCLYDLEHDPDETNNLWAHQPEIRERLVKALLSDIKINGHQSVQI